MVEINFQNYFSDFYDVIKNLDYEHNGMFNSEIFVIYSIYKSLGCNFFIESGIDNAVSTKKLLRFINDDYYGIDLNPSCFGNSIKNTNFRFIHGDSQVEIERLLSMNQGKNIFISIDGPKGESATKLKNELLNHDSVLVVAVHDTYDGLQEDNLNRVFESSTNEIFNEVFFHRLNLIDIPELQTIYNLKNHSEHRTYFDFFPKGPGISIYSKKELSFKF